MQSHTQIQIIGVWRLSVFLFFSREPLPTIFSMLHPLDEIAPIVCKPGGKTCANTFFCSLSESGFYCLTQSCVIFRSLWRIACAVCLWCNDVRSVQLLSALSGCFLWHRPGNTLCLGPTQGHIWGERSYTKVHKPKYGFSYPQGAFLLLQERSMVLRCPVDPVGTPLRLMASGFLTSHLRNMSHLDSPCGGGSHGLASGTGPGFVMCFLSFQLYFHKEYLTRLLYN